MRSCESQDRIAIERADGWTRIVNMRSQNGIRPPLSLPLGIREGGRPERSFYRPGPPGLIPAEGTKGKWRKWRGDLFVTTLAWQRNEVKYRQFPGNGNAMETRQPFVGRLADALLSFVICHSGSTTITPRWLRAVELVHRTRVRVQ